MLPHNISSARFLRCVAIELHCAKCANVQQSVQKNSIEKNVYFGIIELLML